jgi:DNA-binding MarR family transcriptional regulator
MQAERRTQADRDDMGVLADRLRPVILKLSRHLRREAQKVGMSALDAQLLGVVKMAPGVGVSGLADIEQMSRPAMSAHVKRLEGEGWLMRQSDAPDADRRRVNLAVTPKGLQALNLIRRSRNDWLASRLSRLTPADRRDLEMALPSLERLVEVKS